MCDKLRWLPSSLFQRTLKQESLVHVDTICTLPQNCYASYLYLYSYDNGLRSRSLNTHIVPEFVEPVLKRIIDGWCIHNTVREIVSSVDER